MIITVFLWVSLSFSIYSMTFVVVEVHIMSHMDQRVGFRISKRYTERIEGYLIDVSKSQCTECIFWRPKAAMHMIPVHFVFDINNNDKLLQAHSEIIDAITSTLIGALSAWIDQMREVSANIVTVNIIETRQELKSITDALICLDFVELLPAGANNNIPNNIPTNIAYTNNVLDFAVNNNNNNEFGIFCKRCQCFNQVYSQQFHNVVDHNHDNTTNDEFLFNEYMLTEFGIMLPLEI